MVCSLSHSNLSIILFKDIRFNFLNKIFEKIQIIYQFYDLRSEKIPLNRITTQKKNMKETYKENFIHF